MKLCKNRKELMIIFNYQIFVIMNLINHYKNIIENNIDLNSKIAIFPYGNQGVEFKRILNDVYGKKEQYIIDNKLSKYNKEIVDFDEFLMLTKEQFITIVLATTQVELNEYLESEVRRKKADCKIVNIINPVIIEDSLDDYWIELLFSLKLKSISEKDEFIRIGRNYDGGYIMLDDINDTMKAYSFGIFNDISWDKEMAERFGIKVEMYDHTIPREPEYHRLLSFHRIGIGQNDDIEHNLLSLKTILRDNEDAKNNNLILKMDVEGAEYDFINSTDENILKQFRQIIIELHKLDSKNIDIIRAIKKLNKTHQLVWLHGNNYVKASRFENGVIMPHVLEVLFVNRDYYSFDDFKGSLPFEIDQPNMYGVKDFKLGEW